MACSCGSHATDFLCTIQNTYYGAMMSLEASGVLTYASQPVQLAYITKVQPRPFAGDPGGSIINLVTIEPTPISETNTKLYQSDGSIVERTGQAKIRNILAADKEGTIGYTAQQLQSADYWLVGGVQYDLVEGSIARPTSGIFWEVTLLKTKNNGI